jgi:DNA-binding Lrp family transcriptional regulator
LESGEEEILRQTNKLKAAGVIRRIGAVINHRALGQTGTLVAAHVPQENLQEIIEAVNSLQGVSHNYLRKHHYNLWFTLQAPGCEQIEVTLSMLSACFGVSFHSLPVVRIFKLDVHFDPDSKAELLGDVEEIPKTETVELNEKQKTVLLKLQNDLEVIERPFDFLCGADLELEEVLRIIQELIDKGVIRRIAAAVDHRKLGFTANVLFACEVGRDRIVEAGRALARFGAVTHCYQRKTVKDWPYNLFAMMHAKSMGEIQHVVSRFAEVERVDSFELLPTAAELKKQPVKLHLD